MRWTHVWKRNDYLLVLIVEEETLWRNYSIEPAFVSKIYTLYLFRVVHRHALLSKEAISVVQDTIYKLFFDERTEELF